MRKVSNSYLFKFQCDEINLKRRILEGFCNVKCNQIQDELQLFYSTEACASRSVEMKLHRHRQIETGDWSSPLLAAAAFDETNAKSTKLNTLKMEGMQAAGVEKK